jgi:hypothetical protein
MNAGTAAKGVARTPNAVAAAAAPPLTQPSLVGRVEVT